MTVEVLTIVQACTRELAEEEQFGLPDELGPETPLFGERGHLDSLGLVSLVVAVEEAIEDRLGVSISLADERAMSQARSPFRTIGSLAEYAGTLVSGAS